MSLYLDASVLVALLAPDSFSQRAAMLLGAAQAPLIVSDFAAAEFSSAIARLVRVGSWQEPEARACFGDFDVWADRSTRKALVEPGDLRVADGYVRRLDLALRLPDAIHLAMAGRLRARLATFDRRMVDAAAKLGVAVADV